MSSHLNKEEDDEEIMQRLLQDIDQVSVADTDRSLVIENNLQ